MNGVHEDIEGFKKTKHPLYLTWTSIKTRCYNDRHRAWKHYGGRGIRMCDEWLNDFALFVRDVGPRPKGTTLDRYPNRNGNYEPGNVRWATPLQQSWKPHFITHNGQTMQMSEWARKTGIPFQVLYQRFKKGWSLDEAFTTPVRQCGKGTPYRPRSSSLSHQYARQMEGR